MFRIRRIQAIRSPADRVAMASCQRILSAQFVLLDADEIAALPDVLRDPVSYGFKAVLLVADDARGEVLGFALVLHFTDLEFSFLDYISVTPGRTGGGLGAALYERVREEVAAEGSPWLLFECLPDDPAICHDEDLLAQNAARLRFYERYGARPITGTAYETPAGLRDDCPPYLVLDAMDGTRPLDAPRARSAVRAILDRKYSEVCGPEYVQHVTESFRVSPVPVRAPRYLRGPRSPRPHDDLERVIWLTVNDRHEIHHMRDRGYVESPVRVRSILKGIEPTGMFRPLKPHRFGEQHVLAVHDRGFVGYIKKVCAGIPAGDSVYPYVFPIRNQARPPRDLPVRAGYYCIDTFTPLNENAFLAARRAVDCGLTAARALLEGGTLAYALVRPPGHHAERRSFGGFCYFNNAAISAHFLSEHGRVAVLDVDYHHGNGTQDIFWRRDDVLTLSIHGHPRFAYPYFSGYSDETGEGAGEGFNHNYAMPEHVDGATYRDTLERALKQVRRFDPAFLVIALGLDTCKSDPTGTWSLTARDLARNGELVGSLGLPTLVIQEGGYRVRSLGTSARAFFEGLARGAFPCEGRTRVTTRRRTRVKLRNPAS